MDDFLLACIVLDRFCRTNSEQNYMFAYCYNLPIIVVVMIIYIKIIVEISCTDCCENRKTVIFLIISSAPFQLFHRFLCSSKSKWSSPRKSGTCSIFFSLLYTFSYSQNVIIFPRTKVGVIFSFGPMNSSPNDTSSPCKIMKMVKVVDLRVRPTEFV